MNMIRSHVCRPKIPAAVHADFLESIEYSRTSIFVKKICWLVHLLTHRRHTLWIRLR